MEGEIDHERKGDSQNDIEDVDFLYPICLIRYNPNENSLFSNRFVDKGSKEERTVKQKQPNRKTVQTLVSLLLLTVSFVYGATAEGTPLVYAAEQKSEKIISEDEAIHFAKKWLPIPAGYTYGYGNYVEPDGEIETPYGAWSLYWSKGDSDSIIYKIHPVTGQLLYYFNQNQISATPAPVNADRQRVAREGADQFLAHVIPPEERSKLTAPSESIVKSDSPETYRFVYKRIENGIPFDGNYIGISVSGDGKILRFKRLWYEGELPEASRVISEAKARELLQQNTEPTLIYRDKPEYFKSDSSNEQKYMLVYEYQRKDPQLVDAITGEMVDANAEPAKPKRTINSLKAMAPAVPSNTGSGEGGVFTREQAEASALHLVQKTFSAQLENLYMLNPQPYEWRISDLLAHRMSYEVHFGWLKNGIPIKDATFQVRVSPRKGSASFVDKEPVQPPVIVDNDPRRVDVATAKKTEQAMNPVLKLYYKQPFGFNEETGEPKPILVYSLWGDGGVVDGHTGTWISFEKLWEERTKQ